MPSVRNLYHAVLAAALCGFVAAPALACAVPRNLDGLQAEVIGLINAQRGAAGRTALAPSAPLSAAAQDHACDMATHNRLSHAGSDGAKMATRVRRVGYSFRAANENIAQGQTSSGMAVQGWMNSSGHRKNVLANGTREIGIGIAYGAGNMPYWVMISAGG